MHFHRYLTFTTPACKQTKVSILQRLRKYFGQKAKAEAPEASKNTDTQIVDLTTAVEALSTQVEDFRDTDALLTVTVSPDSKSTSAYGLPSPALTLISEFGEQCSNALPSSWPPRNDDMEIFKDFIAPSGTTSGTGEVCARCIDLQEVSTLLDVENGFYVKENAQLDAEIKGIQSKIETMAPLLKGELRAKEALLATQHIPESKPANACELSSPALTLKSDTEESLKNENCSNGCARCMQLAHSIELQKLEYDSLREANVQLYGHLKDIVSRHNYIVSLL
ncbi:hypothetical protein GGI05_005191 [Coemansia sp. RSA 2603]|nr:hypothetical protein GGI05_005191 [Coemansia sp. RSA 2603]